MALEKIDLEHVPTTHQVYAALFRDVVNTEFLHAQLLSRNSEFEYAFVDASSVISRIHLLSAVYSALNTLVNGTLRTPNVHSEIVVSLNINNNVRLRCLSKLLSRRSPCLGSAADVVLDRRRLPTMGNNPGKTKDLIVVKVVPPPASTAHDEPLTHAQTQEAIWAHLTQHVHGTPTLLTDADLSQITDWSKVRKYYRLNGVPALEKLGDEERVKKSENLAIMGMALRGL